MWSLSGCFYKVLKVDIKIAIQYFFSVQAYWKWHIKEYSAIKR